jgi:2-dehydropantoate 2-reductase
MRICIYGAGSVGGLIGGMLAEGGHDVSLVARGEHLKALKSNGLTLETGGRTIHHRLRASDRPADLGVQDYVILTVKAPSLPSVVRDIPPLLGPNTPVVAAMNGIPWWFFQGIGGPHDGRRLQSVDPDGALATGIEPRRTIGCVLHIACSVPKPGVIRHTSGNLYIIGEPNGGPSERCQQLVDSFNASGLKAELSPRIQQAVWAKYLGNLTLGSLSAITGGTLSGLSIDPGTRNICAKIMAEAIAAGAKFDLDPGMTIEERIELGAKLGPFKPSLRQDYEKRRPMEIDTFLSAVIEMAKLVDVPTPTIDTIRSLVVHKARLYDLYPPDKP